MGKGGGLNTQCEGSSKSVLLLLVVNVDLTLFPEDADLDSVLNVRDAAPESDCFRAAVPRWVPSPPRGSTPRDAGSANALVSAIAPGGGTPCPPVYGSGIQTGKSECLWAGFAGGLEGLQVLPAVLPLK